MRWSGTINISISWTKMGTCPDLRAPIAKAKKRPDPKADERHQPAGFSRPPPGSQRGRHEACPGRQAVEPARLAFPRESHRALLRSIDKESIPEQLSVSRPEGFAYYGLHPLSFAEIVDRLPLPISPI